MNLNDFFELTKDIPSNFNRDMYEQFFTFIPDLPKGTFVDFGTCYGRSALCARYLNPDIEIITFDSGDVYDTNYFTYVCDILDRHCGSSIHFLLADSLQPHPSLDNIRNIVGLSIDSEHSYEQTKKEIEKWVPRVVKGGIIFLDDYLVERCGVKQAVDELIKSKPNQYQDLNPNGMCAVFRKLYD